MAAFSRDVLQIDAKAESERIAKELRTVVSRKLKRRGLVVALSGGIDSTAVAYLCVKALGKDRVFGLQMPERDSSATTKKLSQAVVDDLGIDHAFEDITPILEGAGCYRRRDEAIRQVIGDFGPGWKSKIVLPSVVDSDMLRIFSVVAESPSGEIIKERMPPEAYLGVVAATNFKQRTRKMLEYYHADRLNYGVTGTPNLLEYDQGFFVKNGDGAADVKPIAHLYKSQVYQVARALGAPEEICSRAPTTDTYSMPQSQEEFYFSLPYGDMDLCLYAKNHGIGAAEVGKVLGLTGEQVERVFRDIDSKRSFAQYLHMPAQKVGTIPGPSA